MLMGLHSGFCVGKHGWRFEPWLVQKAKKDLKPSFEPSDTGVHEQESSGKAYLIACPADSIP